MTTSQTTQLAAKERSLGAEEDVCGKEQGGFLGMQGLISDEGDGFSSTEISGKSPSIQRENYADREFGKKVLEAVGKLDEMLKEARERDEAAPAVLKLNRGGEMSRDDGDEGALRDSLLKSQVREEEANKQVRQPKSPRAHGRVSANSSAFVTPCALLVPTVTLFLSRLVTQPALFPWRVALCVRSSFLPG